MATTTSTHNHRLMHCAACARCSRGPGCGERLTSVRPGCAAGDLGAGPGRRVWECGLLLAAYLGAHAGPSSLAGGLVANAAGSGNVTPPFCVQLGYFVTGMGPALPRYCSTAYGRYQNLW